MVFLFLHIVQARSNFVSSVNKLLNARCKEQSLCIMLAAVQATAKRLIAPRYLMGQNNVWTNLDDMLNQTVNDAVAHSKI